MVKLEIADRGGMHELAPTKIIGIGLNYRDHIEESHSVKVRGFDREVPAEPVIFPMTPNALVGPEEPIVIPSFLADYGFDELRVDYEGELAFIVKDRCRNVRAEDALRHILGFTCMNDVSQRNLQTGDKGGWYRGKSLDTFAPAGPRIVLTEDIGDPQSLDIRTRLNGRVVQESNTRHMIFSIGDLLAFLSRSFTMMPGDIVSTGTPSGVGPLRPGDTVEVEVERIGVLRNAVRAEADGPAD